MMKFPSQTPSAYVIHHSIFDIFGVGPHSWKVLRGAAMSLPPLDETGNLPGGIHSATLTEVVTQFGATRGRRGVCTQRLSHIYQLAQRTEHLQRFLIFGSYVTSEAAPNDVDVVLVMDDAFRWEECPVETRGLFEHAAAQARYGASIFWIRPSLLIRESVEDFLASWQLKRDGTRRGIVEVVP